MSPCAVPTASSVPISGCESKATRHTLRTAGEGKGRDGRDAARARSWLPTNKAQRVEICESQEGSERRALPAHRRPGHIGCACPAPSAWAPT